MCKSGIDSCSTVTGADPAGNGHVQNLRQALQSLTKSVQSRGVMLDMLGVSNQQEHGE